MILSNREQRAHTKCTFPKSFSANGLNENANACIYFLFPLMWRMPKGKLKYRSEIFSSKQQFDNCSSKWKED